MQTLRLTSENTIEEQSVYHYNELPDDAKDRARQNYIEHWVDNDWWSSSVIDDAKSNGVERGFEIEHIYWSGFWSQGDGASWIGEVYLPDFIKFYMQDSIGTSAWLWLIEDGWIHDRVGITQSGRYYHEMTMGVDQIESYIKHSDLDPEDTLDIDCILKGAPVRTVYNLIEADTKCEARSYDALEQLILDKAREHARSIYARLNDAYDYEVGDENIGETYDANQILFNQEGVAI